MFISYKYQIFEFSCPKSKLNLENIRKSNFLALKFKISVKLDSKIEFLDRKLRFGTVCNVVLCIIASKQEKASRIFPV